MCGIVGLYLKDPAWRPQLGRHLGDMLIEMSGRGPDSAGIAVYRDSVGAGQVKLTLFHEDPDYGWDDLSRRAAARFGEAGPARPLDRHCVLTLAASGEAARTWLAEAAPAVRIVSSGDTIEIYKEKGLPREVAARFDLDRFEGSHALGHTRMATESAVTTQHSHPFSTGEDLCLVHNGSLSNHNRLRARLERRGIAFETDNDSEVAAGYFAHHLAEGASLAEAVEAGLSDLDGFYTFAIGTRDGFAVVRDGIACKPAVMAETAQWVAMASEFRAIARLPGAETARIWEPEPERIYVWEGA